MSTKAASRARTRLIAPRVERKDDETAPFDGYNGGGLGMAAWVGYGGWVAPEWQLGEDRLPDECMREVDGFPGSGRAHETVVGRGCECGHQGPAFETGAGRVPVESFEMIEEPGMLERRVGVGLPAGPRPRHRRAAKAPRPRAAALPPPGSR